MARGPCYADGSTRLSKATTIGGALGLGTTGRMWGDPVIARITITPSCQRHVHLTTVTRKISVAQTDASPSLGEGKHGTG